MRPRFPKSALYEQLARIGRGLSSPSRLELIDLLCQGEKSVETLAAQAGLSVKNASAHLRALREGRLVDTRKEGRHVYYRLADEGVCTFFLALRGLAEVRLAELREVAAEYYRGHALMTPVDRERLLQRVATGEVTVLDVRPVEEFRAGHIPGARSVPLAELRQTLAAIPKDQEIVAYCRGPYCVMALEAVELLGAEGYRARRLADGVGEWRAAGLPIERG